MLTAMFDVQRVKALRERLGLTQTEFARTVGADVRSVARWESGESQPSGSAVGVLTALEMTLEKHPEKDNEIAKFIVGAAAVGGLAFLLMKLLESVVENGKIKG